MRKSKAQHKAKDAPGLCGARKSAASGSARSLSYLSPQTSRRGAGLLCVTTRLWLSVTLILSWAQHLPPISFSQAHSLFKTQVTHACENAELGFPGLGQAQAGEKWAKDSRQDSPLHRLAVSCSSKALLNK